MIVMFRHQLPLVAAALASTLLLAGCGSDANATSEDDGRLQVVTSFYPLQFLTQRIGGPLVHVTSLTRPGAEPHDLELTPRDVARLQDADVVVYLRGFQPAVDQAVDEHTKGQRVLDVAPAAQLDLVREDAALGDEHAAERHDDHGADPHFWLDPIRFADVAQAVAAALDDAEPSAHATFASSAHTLVDDLRALDTEYRRGLASCSNRDLVTSHSAFGYLAERYGFRQVGITGLAPEAEPDPRSLADVSAFVRQNDVSTIYYETLVSPAVARTVAREAGATTAVLDPIEGLDDTSAGRDYLEVMRSNLDTLRKGQSCS
jgi:zinc transport system substrate-binding protein